MRRVGDRLLTVGALLGAAMLLLGILAVALNIRPVFLRSGSMAPDLPTGTLAFARQVDASALEVGDVVTVRTDGGSRVTHRITDLRRDGATAVLTLRGDANASADAQSYRVTEAHRVLGQVPWLGRVAAALRTPPGLVAIGAFVTWMLMLVLRRSGPPKPPTRRGSRNRGRHLSRRRVVAVAAVAFVLLGPGQVQGAWAAPWTDNVGISGSTLTAGTIAVPATFTCGALGVLSVTFNWAAVSGATSYTLYYGSGGASSVTVTGTSRTLTSAISSGTAWVVANRDFGSTTWTSAPSVSRTYTVAVVSLCS